MSFNLPWLKSAPWTQIWSLKQTQPPPSYFGLDLHWDAKATKVSSSDCVNLHSEPPVGTQAKSGYPFCLSLHNQAESFLLWWRGTLNSTHSWGIEAEHNAFLFHAQAVALSVNPRAASTFSHFFGAEGKENEGTHTPFLYSMK